MRIMRSDYNKAHRCPSWSGPGWVWRKNYGCENGYIKSRAWGKWYAPFEFARCSECDVITLPLFLQWFEWRTWQYRIVWPIREALGRPRRFD